MNIAKGIVNLYDYLKCSLTSKAGRYQAVYIEQTMLAIDDKRQVNIGMHPVIFEEEDKLPVLPNSEVVPGSDWVEADLTGSIYYDSGNKIVFLLDSRLYGGKDGRTEVSMMDTHRNRLRFGYNMLKFLGELLKNDDELRGARLGQVRNKPSIRYKDLVHG